MRAKSFRQKKKKKRLEIVLITSMYYTTRILKKTWKFYETAGCYTTLNVHYDADIKIYWDLRLHIKIICRRFHIVALLRDAHPKCLKELLKNIQKQCNMLKSSLRFKEKAKFKVSFLHEQGYIGRFQTCISVPLSSWLDFYRYI